MMKFNQSVKVFNSNSWKLMKVFDNLIISVPIAPSTPKLLTIGVDFIEVSTTVSNADALWALPKSLSTSATKRHFNDGLNSVNLLSMFRLYNNNILSEAKFCSKLWSFK